MPGLHAIGEVACTGLHGANRMASNSLLECLVYGRSCGQRLRTARVRPDANLVPGHWGMRVVDPDAVATIREEMRQLMSARVAIVRTDRGLDEAARELGVLYQDLVLRVREAIPSVAMSNLWHALRLARLTVACARARRESRGLHYNPDCSVHAETNPRPSRIRLEDLETR